MNSIMTVEEHNEYIKKKKKSQPTDNFKGIVNISDYSFTPKSKNNAQESKVNTKNVKLPSAKSQFNQQQTKLKNMYNRKGVVTDSSGKATTSSFMNNSLKNNFNETPTFDKFVEKQSKNTPVELAKRNTQNQEKYNKLKQSETFKKQEKIVNDLKQQSKKESSNQNGKSWLNLNAFVDGYQPGDISKSIKSTAIDIGTNLLKGGLRAGESIGDLAAYGGAQIVGLFGAKDYANQVRKAAAEDLTGKIFQPADKELSKYSLLGDKSKDVVSSIGNMYAQAVTSAKLLGAKGNIPLSIGGKKFNLPVTSIISGASSGMGEAVNKNAEDWQIWANGLTSGLAEGISESLFGTFGIGGSDLDDAIVNGITKNMKNGLVKSLTRAGIKATGEGAEEVASYLLNYGSEHLLDFAKNKTNLKGVDLAEEFNNEELWDNFFSGALAAGIGGLPSTINSIRGNQTSGININEGVNQFNRNNAINQNLQINNSNNSQQLNIQQNNALQSNGDITNNIINQNIGKEFLFPKIIQKSNNNQQINAINNIFSQQVDEVVNGTFNKENHMTVLEHTPQVLQNLGVKDLPITLTVAKLDRIMNDSGKQQGEYHGLHELVKKLPNAIENPLDIIKSHNNSYVLTTDLSDNQDRSIIVSIKIDGKGYIDNIEVDSNVMTSAYGRNNYDTWMQKNLKNGDIVYDIDRGYINNKKIVNIPGLQLPNNINNLSTNDNSTNNQQSQIAPLPINSNMQQNQNNTQQNIPTSKDINKVNMPPVESNQNNNKTLNPIEISQLTKEDANTTPNLPKVNRNKVNDGKSKFASNIENKVNMLNEEQKSQILSDKDSTYYDTVTNKESLEKAFDRLEKNNRNETMNWFNKPSENANSTDVAEGWILLKQYADNKNYDGMVEIAKKLRDIGTKAGQTVQAFNIMERMTPEGMVKYAQSELQEAYEKMIKNKSQEWINKYRSDFELKPEEVQFIMDNMKEISTMEDGYGKRVKLAEIQKLMTDKLPPAKGSGIKSWMRISMLFNPKTQVRNVVGNAIIMPVNSFSDLFSSYADKIISKKTGIRTTGKTNVKAMLKGMKEGAYQATNDYKKGINTKDMSGNRFEITEGKNFNDKTLMGKSLNRVEGMLNYVMDAGDRVFSQAAFENSLQNQMVLNNTTEITQDMLDIARTESLQRTWNDNNNYTKFVLGIRRFLNIAHVGEYGVGDVLIPFAKTPANLTKAIVDYSPFGLVNTIVEGNNLRKSLTNGQFTPQMQHKFVQDLGKATAGTMLYVLGYALAKSGRISGESDDDKDVSNFMKNTLGISSYSIKIGNKSFTYDWAQPIAAPLSIMANVVNSKNNKGQALTEAVVGSLDTAGSILLEQSFLQSINEVFNDNDGVVSGLINEMLDLPARAVPTFSKQIADMVDGTQRTSFEYGKPIQSAVNSFKAKIPFVSKSLAPTVDTMGREIQKYGGKNNIFNVFLNPANVNTENISESAKEMYRLYKEVGDNTIMPRVAPYYINKKGEKITLDSKQRAEYQKTSGDIIEKEVKNLLASKDYKSMSNKLKSDVISDIVNYSYNIAQKELLGLELFNTYQKAYDYSKVGNISEYYTFKNSIDNTDSDTKRESIKKFLISSNLNDEKIAKLYGNHYSSDSTLNALLTLKIPIKEFIKLDSQDIQGSYNIKTGKTISGTKKQAVMQYINTLNLSVPQKAVLIKMNYNSFDQYDNQIINYVRNLNETVNDKQVLLKQIGFDDFDKDVINYINSQKLTQEEKESKLKDLGFTIRDGRVYW